jgi:two-component system chemotaxis sensor kinase CheA
MTPPKERRSDQGYIRVKRDKLDFLVNTVGELIILQAQLMRESKTSDRQSFKTIAEQLEKLSITIRDATMYMRMVPIEEVFAGLQRVVHDTAKRLGKDAGST